MIKIEKASIEFFEDNRLVVDEDGCFSVNNIVYGDLDYMVKFRDAITELIDFHIKNSEF